MLSLGTARPAAAGDASGAAASQACTRAPTCEGSLRLATGKSIPYYATRPLTGSSDVTRAVVVVHGNDRDADRYFEAAVAAARAEVRLGDSLLLAPRFQARGDGPSPEEHFWSAWGWKIGNRSQDALRISSFAVMDELLARICPPDAPAFPRLETVVIMGHSAGGQFVNRYAAGGRGCPNPVVEVRYVVMNPSSYLYVDGRRRSPDGPDFAPPDSGCPGYDDYKYGLRDLNAYLRSVGAARIRTNLLSRRVWYLAGEHDVRTGASLDRRCPALLQGAHRLERFRNYERYRELFGDWTGSEFGIVPGVGHSGSEMLMSELARRITFR